MPKSPKQLLPVLVLIGLLAAGISALGAVRGLALLCKAAEVVAAFGLVIGFHELGHFVVARLLGIGVREFSLGVGPLLAARRNRLGIQYSLRGIPLGGFVDVKNSAYGEKFETSPRWKQALVVIAGPAASLLLAWPLFSAASWIGVPSYWNHVSVPSEDSIAAAAGIRSGDWIESIGDRKTATWFEVSLALAKAAGTGRPVQVGVRHANSDRETLLLNVPSNSTEDLGLFPEVPYKPVVDSVDSDSPAAGLLKPGDVVEAIDQVPLKDIDSEGSSRLHVLADARQDRATVVQLRRDAQRLTVTLHARFLPGESRPRLGIAWQLDQAASHEALRTTQLTLIQAIDEGGRQVLDNLRATIQALHNSVSGQNSVHQLRSDLAGPVSIAVLLGQASSSGAAMYLNVVGMLTIGLFLMNLMPIPILDGGQLLLITAEALRRKPFAERARGIYAGAGVVAVVLLSGIALGNDLMNLYSP